MPTEKVQKKEKIPIKRSKNRKRKKQDEVRKERKTKCSHTTDIVLRLQMDRH